MTEAYEVGITLALQDGVSAGIANIRRDLAALDRAIAATSANLAGLRVAGGALVASTPAPPRVQPPSVAALPSDAPSQNTTARLPGQSNPVIFRPAQQPAPQAAEPALQSLVILQREATTAPAAPATPGNPVASRESVAIPAPPPPPATPLSTARLPPTPETASSPTRTFAPTPDLAPPSARAFAALPPVPVASPADAPLPPPARLVAATLPPFVEPRGRSPPPPGTRITPLSSRAATPAQTPTVPARQTPQPSAPAVRQTHHHSTAFTTPRAAQPGAPPAQSTLAAPVAAPSNAAALAPSAASPPASFAPPPQAQQSMTLQGDIILDGARVGRWMTSTLARQAARPPSGPTGPDPRQTPLWSGQAQGF